MDNFHLKKQLLLDIEEAERFKELNIELMEHLSFTANWILDYCEKNNLKPPNVEKLHNTVKKCRGLFERMNGYYFSPNFKHPNGTPKESPEPKFDIIIDNAMKKTRNCFKRIESMVKEDSMSLNYIKLYKPANLVAGF